MLFLVLLIGLYLALPVAAENVAGNSASINYIAKAQNTAADDSSLAIKKKAIKQVLEKYQSTLVMEVDNFISTCVKYDLDCFFLPAIAGVESSFGNAVLPNSYNPFGWGRGLINFSSWSQAIDTVGRGLREDYINKGATTIDQIGAIYCEGNTWTAKVRFFMEQINNEAEKSRLLFIKNPVEL